MVTRLLIDTDVLIDYLRDYPDAVSYVEAQQERLLICLEAATARARTKKHYGYIFLKKGHVSGGRERLWL